ncbi:MAG: hypothetical protein K0U78_02225 [Actinomycetia bacterium]|nr:hypothetical protein [Actinomycetes bacterium]
MNANEKLQARYRARQAQAEANDKRCRRDRANADDAAAIRGILHRVSAVDTWERKRLDQATENIRADAAQRRAGNFAGFQAAVDQMRGRGQTLASIAALVGVEVRDIRSALRRARTGDDEGPGLVRAPGAAKRSARSNGQNAGTDSGDPACASADHRSRNGDGADRYDPTRCIRCDAVMLDADAAPQRGRRRIYCSDTCRRDASAARTAAQRYGSPIRVVEVPKAVASLQQTETDECAVSNTLEAVTPLDAVDIALRSEEALHVLLARVAEQARLKKLDRSTLTVARELGRAVLPLRT